MGYKAFVSLGSNLGDRKAYLGQALALLKEAGLTICKASACYQTKPVDYLEQADFLNMVVQLETEESPERLLGLLQRIEIQCGRKREIPKGPRTLDLDILLYDTLVLQTPKLTIPHQELCNRGFVLLPLKEIAPSLVLPNGKSVLQLVDELTPQQRAGVCLFH